MNPVRPSLCLFFLFIGLSNLLSAQDIIYFQDGTELKSKILEIKTEVISYKKNSNLTGPTYESLKSDIYKIKYQNGEIEVISKENNEAGTGIKFTLLAGDTIQITSITNNSSAAEMGLLAGDKIVKIDTYTKDKFMNESTIQNFLDGPKGSKVDITLIRTNQKSTFLFTLERKLPVIVQDVAIVTQEISVLKDTAKTTNGNNTKVKPVAANMAGVITSSKHIIGFMAGPAITSTIFQGPEGQLNGTPAPLMSYKLGFYYNLNFTPSFSLRTALSFSGHDNTYEEEAINETYLKVNYMDLYVGVQYNIAKPWKIQPYLHFGPTLSVMLSGGGGNTKTGWTYDVADQPNSLKWVGFGANLGVGAKWNIWKKLFISAEYEMYLSILNTEGEDAQEGQETRYITIGSFLFGAGWILK